MISHKKILITGGTGFIGSHIAERFAETNDVVIYDIGRRNALQYISPEIQKLTVIHGDVLDRASVKKAMKGISIVLHLAAIAGVSSYQENPLKTIQVNLLGTNTVLEVASEIRPEQIITFSTSEVYGPRAFNVNELNETPIGTLYENRWSYAVSKVASDHLAMAYFKKEQLPVSIVRPFNVYGPRQVGEGAISRMFEYAYAKKVIEVTGDGAQKRAWCYVSDFVDAIEKMIEKKTIGECFNIGNPKDYCSISKLAQEIKRAVPGISITHTPARSEEIYTRKPDITRAAKILKFSPTVSLTEGIAQTALWYKSQSKS